MRLRCPERRFCGSPACSVKAIEYLERSRRINPRDMFTITTLGNVSSRAKKLARSGQSGAAIKLLEAGLEEHTTNVFFFLNQAEYVYKRTCDPKGRPTKFGNSPKRRKCGALQRDRQGLI